MLKSNSKAVCEKIRCWILENIDFSGYDEWVTLDYSNYRDVCRALLETCEKEKFSQQGRNARGLVLRPA